MLLGPIDSLNFSMRVYGAFIIRLLSKLKISNFVRFDKRESAEFSQLRILLLIFKRLAKVALLVLVLPHSNAGEESGDHLQPYISMSVT